MRSIASFRASFWPTTARRASTGAKSWQDKLGSFQHDIAQVGYRFQFVTLAGFHSLNLAMFNLARDYCKRGMAAYSELQQAEFAAEAAGYTATRHQREVGVGYFDAIAMAISGGSSSTAALAGSTETAQFQEPEAASRPAYGHDEGLWCTTMTGPSTTGRQNEGLNAMNDNTMPEPLSPFPRKRESRAKGSTPTLDPRFRARVCTHLVRHFDSLLHW
jgi:hypothetical protein